jgi:hypothetical protein
MPLFPVQWLWQSPRLLLLGVPFSLAIMGILLAHEMGHYLYCRHYGVRATLPFFIPAPTLIGTLGAFIRIGGYIESRAALFDIGIAGPIAGFVVAVPTMLAGTGNVTSGDRLLRSGVAVRLSADLPAGTCTAAPRRTGAGALLSASGGAGGLGRNAGNRPEPASGRTAGWRSPGLCRLARAAQISLLGSGGSAGGNGVVLLGRAG